jgi:nucleotide-binding universal stress UspA family protein
VTRCHKRLPCGFPAARSRPGTDAARGARGHDHGVTGIFDRVVCGVDGSTAGTIAARQAARLTAPDGELSLVAVDDPSVAVHAGWEAGAVLSALADEARKALERGRVATAGIHEARTVLAEGHPADVLFHEARERDATLLAVGCHGHTRAVGIVLGSVATLALHEAPCPVLVARGAEDDVRWPRAIVVGVDGSPESADALEAARALGARLAVPVTPVVATEDPRIDLDRVRSLAPDVEEHEARPVDVLAVASEHAGLVVVGSRGLHGIHALGSVSERVGHEARCSVLVVRRRAPGT